MPSPFSYKLKVLKKSMHFTWLAVYGRVNTIVYFEIVHSWCIFVQAFVGGILITCWGFVLFSLNVRDFWNAFKVNLAPC